MHRGQEPVRAAEFEQALLSAPREPWADVAGLAVARQRVEAKASPQMVDLPSALTRGMVKRQREFLAGRACAQRALRHAGYTGTDLSLLQLPGGAPAWPVGWLGSISHTDDHAVAVVAAAPSCRLLGVDRETLIDLVTAQDISPSVAAPGELEPLLVSTDLAWAVSVLFSAKEALFKALSASLGGFADFTAARLVRCVPGGIELRLCIDWGHAWPAGTVLPIRVAQTPEAVETLLYISR